MSRPFSLKKRGKVWYIRFSGEANYHTTGFSDRDRAEGYALRAFHGRGVHDVVEHTDGLLLREYASDFFIWDSCVWVARQLAKKRPLSKAVASNRRAQLINYLFPRFGDTELCNITAVEIEDWLVSLPLANQTRNHILYTLSIVLRDAKRTGLIESNPAEDVEPMGKDFRPTLALSDDELGSLFPADPGRFAAVWPVFQYGVMHALMVSSGMRPGEARALEWTSVIFDIPAVLVVQAFNASEELGETKGKWRRGALLPDRTAQLLRAWKKICGCKTGFVFRNDAGNFVSRTGAYWHFCAGLKRTAIPAERKRISPRSLRTTYNTRMRQMLLANSIPEDLLRFFIGH